LFIGDIERYGEFRVNALKRLMATESAMV